MNLKTILAIVCGVLLGCAVAIIIGALFLSVYYLSFYLRSLRKIPKFHLISWCGNVLERLSFRRVSGASAGNSAETVPFQKKSTPVGEILVFYAVVIIVF